MLEDVLGILFICILVLMYFIIPSIFYFVKSKGLSKVFSRYIKTVLKIIGIIASIVGSMALFFGLFYWSFENKIVSTILVLVLFGLGIYGIYDIFCGNHGGSSDEILGARISNSDLHDD